MLPEWVYPPQAESRGATRVGLPSPSRDLNMPEEGSPTDICRKCDPGKRIASARALG